MSAAPRAAIIDIGSNSIRLVVYQGPARLPAILFNEKVLAGLGKGLAGSGRIEPESLAMARTALARFATLAREMGAHVRTVATAAVRDAANGSELIAAANAVGLEVELLSGEQEALAAGAGVLSAFPDADGIVGDLGGGSLELVRVSGGTIGDRVSFPLGVLRVAAMRGAGDAAFERAATRMIADAGWTGRGAGLPFYLVGGSWRALAHLHMHLSAYPLPVVHGYTLAADALPELARVSAPGAKPKLRGIPGLSSGRIPTLGDAAAILSLALQQLASASTIVSAFGLREGLLYQTLDDATRAQDPLIVACRDEGRREGRFPEHGDELDRWLTPLFATDPPAAPRLRHAACLLADVGWRANPDFRSERGVEVALHGNWVGIDGPGRACLAQALHTGFGGGTGTPAPLGRLASPEALARAVQWGLAIRLAQRFSAGLAGPLERSRIGRSGTRITLQLAPGDRGLYGEAVQKRHEALATAMAGQAAVI